MHKKRKRYSKVIDFFRKICSKVLRSLIKNYPKPIHLFIKLLICVFVITTFTLIICFVFESDISSSKEMFNLFDKLFSCPKMTSFLSNAYKMGYDFLISLDIDNKLIDFNLMLSMEMICSAAMVFLYSRFGENTYGLPVEHLIHYAIGHWVLRILRIAALVLPFFCLFCILMKYKYVVLISLVDIYIIISIFVLLSLEIMQKKKTFVLIDVIFHKEWKKLNQERKRIIPVFLHGNYLKKIFCIKTKLCTSAEVYRLLSWETINLLLNNEDLESKIETVEKIFSLLSKYEDNYRDVNFINIFNITYGMLETKNLGDSLKLYILRKFTLNLNEYSKNSEETYEEKYYAIILAILYSQKKEAMEYLWKEFFYGLNQRSMELNLRLYIYSFKIIEILIEKGIVSELTLNLALSVKADIDYLKGHYTVGKIQGIHSQSFNVRLSFLLSVIGIMDQEIAMSCLTEFDQDMLRKNIFYKTGFWNLAR